jgi:hypothetical protein
MAARGNTWETPLGDSPSYTVTIKSGGAAILNTYTGTETLTATVWEGCTQAPLAGVLSLEWNTPAAATVNVLVNGSATASLNQGWYRVRLEVTFQGNKTTFYSGWLRLEPIPGTAVEPPTYGTLQDLLNRSGDFLPRLMQETSETNFLYERGRARSYLDEIIVNRSRVFAYRFDLNYALYYGSFPFGPVEAPDQVIAGYLAANFLMVIDRTLEIVSYKALELICEHRIPYGTEQEDEYVKRAARYSALCRRAVRGYRCSLDINNDGLPDIAFNLSVHTFR